MASEQPTKKQTPRPRPVHFFRIEGDREGNLIFRRVNPDELGLQDKLAK